MTLEMILSLTTLWVIVAVPTAITLGRTASAAEHEREMDVLHRELRHFGAY